MTLDEYRALTAKPARRSKYNAVKVERHGRVFDSIAEADRASSLILLERARVIRSLSFQVPFHLKADNHTPVCTYRLDFVYFEAGHRIAEDVKGFETAAWKLKAKMFLAQYGHEYELRITDKHGNTKPFRMHAPKEAA